MPDEIKKLVYEFWLSPDISRTTGNKRDIKRQRLAPKVYVTQPIHVLEITQSEAYRKFKLKYKDVKISQRQFEIFKPYFVVRVRQKDRATCCCKQHVETRALFRRIMEQRRLLLKSGRHSEEEFPIFEHLNDLVESTMCEKGEAIEFKRECIERNCDFCGVDKKFKTMEAEITNAEESPHVNWEKFEYVTLDVKGKSTRKLSLLQKRTKPGEMMSHFLKLLNDFSSHQFRATWQSTQLRNIIEKLPKDHAVCVHDFSENFRCSEKVEIQSNYFQRTEISIHVSLIYRHPIPEIDEETSSVNNTPTIIEHFFVISDDTGHDRHFTYYAQQQIAEYLKSIKANISVMHEFTDGCSAQYKSRNCMADVCNNVDNLGYSQIIRNFFETSHAKGAQDAAGGFIKRQADLAILRNKAKIRNARDLFLFAEETLQHPKTGIYKQRIFRYVNEIPRNRCDDFNPVPENHKIHQVMSSGQNNKLIVRKLSCYECNTCRLGQPETCSMKTLLGEEKYVRLKPRKIQTVENFVETPKVDIKTLITPGSLVAVFTEDSEYEYYLLKVTHSPVVLKEDVVDDWNASFKRGAEVVKGFYYDRINDSGDYGLIKKKQAMVHVIAVTYVCVEMTAKMKIHIPEELNSDIISSLDEIVETS